MNYIGQEMILMNKKIQEKFNYQKKEVEELKSELNEKKKKNRNRKIKKK